MSKIPFTHNKRPTFEQLLLDLLLHGGQLLRRKIGPLQTLQHDPRSLLRLYDLRRDALDHGPGRLPHEQLIHRVLVELIRRILTRFRVARLLSLRLNHVLLGGRDGRLRRRHLTLQLGGGRNAARRQLSDDLSLIVTSRTYEDLLAVDRGHLDFATGDLLRQVLIVHHYLVRNDLQM